VSAKIASGVAVEMSTTTMPAAYVYPTTVTSISISSAYRFAPTSVVFGIAPFDTTNNAGSVSMYLRDAAPSTGLIVWLDGSDPLGTGDAPPDNTTVVSWVDKSGNNKNCVPVTAGQAVQVFKASTPGITKGCVFFPGNTGVARVPFPSNQFPVASYTISVMCKATSYDTADCGYLVSGPQSFYNLFFGMWLTKFQVWNNWPKWVGTAPGVTSVGMNETFTMKDTWAHLCVTYTGGTIQPYVNGVAFNAISTTQAWPSAQPDIFIGGSPNSGGIQKLTMSLAELRIYETALSATDVASLDAYLKAKFIESGVVSTTSPLLIGQGTLDTSGNVRVSSCVFPMVGSAFMLYARFTSPEGVVQGGYATSATAFLISVTEYQLPSSISTASLVQENTLPVGSQTVVQTATLSGPSTANLTASNITVFLSTSSTPVSNGTVTGYNAATGTVTFTVTPTTKGMSALYIKVVAPVLGSTQSTTLAFLGATGQGFFVDVGAPLIVTLVTSNSGAIATRVLNGSSYTCIRTSGTLTVPTAIANAEILMIAGGGGGSFSAGAGGGAGGAAYISNASIAAGTYSVTIGTGGAASATDGSNGSSGANSVAFGVTVYGGGGGAHSSSGYVGGCGGGGGYGTGTVGGGVTAATGSVTGITGTLQTYGNSGGGNPTSNSYVGGVGAGGGIGGVGGSATATPAGGIGGIGKSTWSDWCAACGVGEGDVSSVFWIGGGGGGSCNETSSTRRAGEGGKGGGGRGGFGTAMTAVGTDGLATAGLDYSGGGGGGGHITLPASLQGGYVPPGGRGGSGVIIIKQANLGVYEAVGAPTDVTGLQVWLDGADPNNGAMPTNGATVSIWVDKSGNARSAVPVGANKAVYRGAGAVSGIKTTLGAMYFNNTPYKIPYTGFSPSTYTIFAVFRADRGLNTAGLSMTPVVSNNSCYVLTGTREYQLYFGMFQDKFSTSVGAESVWNGGMSANTPSTSIRGQWVLATMQYNASTKMTTTFMNGIPMTPKGPDTIEVVWNDLYIGQNNSAGADYRLNGYIGEILIYNSVIAATDRMRIETYLSLKYGFGIDVAGLRGDAYKMPSSFTYSPVTGYVEGAAATMTIATTGASVTSAPLVVYYGSTAGITRFTSLTQAGTGTLVSGSSTVSATFPLGTWYVYICVTSPYGAQGPIVGAVATITSVRAASSTTITAGTLAYNASRTLTLSFSDSSGNDAGLVGTSVTDAINYVTISQATAPIWATDSSGLLLVGARTVDTSGNVQISTAWPDELGSALVAALPLDTSGVVLDVRGLAGGLSGALSVACSGTLALSSTVSRYYRRSVTFNGVSTSVQLTGLPATLLQSDWTIECWVYASSIAASSAVFGMLDTSGNVLLKTILNSNNTVSVSAVDASGLLARVTSASSSIGVGVWVHMAVVEYKNTLAIYVNGTLAQSTAATSSLWYNTRSVASLAIGHNGLSSERLTGNMQDLRVYMAAKYTSNFSAAFTPMPIVALSNITRVGQTLRVPIVATSYRRARLFVSAKIASGVAVEMSTTTMPVAYVYPTTVTSISISSAYRTVPTSVVFSVAPYDGTNAGSVSMFLTDVSGVVSSSSPLLIGQGTLDTSGNVRMSTCVFHLAGSAFQFFAKVTSPEGVVQGGFVTSAAALQIIVSDYPLPSSITQTTLTSTSLAVGTMQTAQTLTLSGANTANLSASNIAVYLNTSSTPVSNCTVKGYVAATGVVTFSATPTVSGMNTLYVIVTAGSGRATEYITYNGTLTVVEGPVNWTWNFASTTGTLDWSVKFGYSGSSWNASNPALSTVWDYIVATYDTSMFYNGSTGAECTNSVADKSNFISGNMYIKEAYCDAWNGAQAVQYLHICPTWFGFHYNAWGYTGTFSWGYTKSFVVTAVGMCAGTGTINRTNMAAAGVAFTLYGYTSRSKLDANDGARVLGVFAMSNFGVNSTFVWSTVNVASRGSFSHYKWKQTSGPLPVNSLFPQAFMQEPTPPFPLLGTF
jgi:hypothetical protein